MACVVVIFNIFRAAGNNIGAVGTAAIARALGVSGNVTTVNLHGTLAFFRLCCARACVCVCVCLCVCVCVCVCVCLHGAAQGEA